MAKHTKVNLKQVENMAEQFGPEMEARFARRDLEAEKTGISYQRLGPDFRQPFGHHHEQQEEIYVVVSGGGRIAIDDEVIELEPWDAVRVAPEARRALEAGPEGIEYLAFGAPRGREEPADAETHPGWWAGG